MTALVTLHCPTVYTTSTTLATHPPLQPPSPDQFLGQWYITYTSSPAWHDKRNVTLTYSLLPSAGQLTQPFASVDDQITYQTLSSSKIQTIRGTDTQFLERPYAWTWRGTGWLKLASSYWEILGYGETEDGQQWMVVHAQKSVFTPAVINVYTRRKEGLSEEVRKSIETALEGFKHEPLTALVKSLYVVRQDRN